MPDRNRKLIKKKIYVFLRDFGRNSAHEVAPALGLSIDYVSKIMKELQKVLLG